eukprot:405171-Lingulodinium_polyedra.AAC.1
MAACGHAGAPQGLPPWHPAADSVEDDARLVAGGPARGRGAGVSTAVGGGVLLTRRPTVRTVPRE